MVENKDFIERARAGALRKQGGTSTKIDIMLKPATLKKVLLDLDEQRLNYHLKNIIIASKIYFNIWITKNEFGLKN